MGSRWMSLLLVVLLVGLMGCANRTETQNHAETQQQAGVTEAPETPTEETGRHDETWPVGKDAGGAELPGYIGDENEKPKEGVKGH